MREARTKSGLLERGRVRVFALACVLSLAALVFGLLAPQGTAQATSSEFAPGTIATSISSAEMTVEPAGYYTGSALRPACAVKLGGKTLEHGKDYTLTYRDNVKAGTASVTATGTGSYYGKVRRTFRISPVRIEDARIVGLFDSYAQTGQPIRPEVSVVRGSTPLDPATDYDILYARNVYLGKATLTVIGRGNYAGIVSASFDVVKGDSSSGALVKRSLDVVDVRCVASEYRYTGAQVAPQPKLTFLGEPLIPGVDYKCSYKNNVDAGTATLTVKGKGRYAGKRSVTFDIKPVSLKRATVPEIPKVYYGGYAIEPPVEVSLGDTQLVRGEDYDVSYQNNVEPGIATVTITGKGNYRGKKVVEFRIERLGDALARRACELAYSRPAYHGGGYNGTQAYIAEFRAVGFRGIYRACDRGIATVIHSAGYDYAFPKALENIVRYLGYSTKSYTSGHGDATPQTSKWQQLGRYSKGDEFRGKMLPGDIVVSGGHICMYVGESIPQEVYATTLAGTSGDLGQPTEDAVWVSAHFNGSLNSAKNAALCIGNYRYALPGLAHGPGYIYRCIDPDCV